MKNFLAVFILVTGLAVVIYSEVKADSTSLKEKINKAICDIVKYRLIELDPREYFDIHLSNPNLPSIVNEENFWYFIYKTVDHYTWNSLIDLSKYQSLIHI